MMTTGMIAGIEMHKYLLGFQERTGVLRVIESDFVSFRIRHVHETSQFVPIYSKFAAQLAYFRSC
jgi:hypothetical protein